MNRADSGKREKRSWRQPCCCISDVASWCEDATSCEYTLLTAVNCQSQPPGYQKQLKPWRYIEDYRLINYCVATSSPLMSVVDVNTETSPVVEIHYPYAILTVVF